MDAKYLWENQIGELASRLERESRFSMTKEFIQHGTCSVYEHCLRVAGLSCRIAARLPGTADMDSLMRGALLHDYFLYDWHEKDSSHRLHGFFHPGKALENAREDFLLTAREEDIISRHMFPLTPIPPITREAWIVCMADKICSLQETLSPYLQYLKKR